MAFRESGTTEKNGPWVLLNELGDLTPARNRDRQGAKRATYFITFVCYGTWLPGQAGAVARNQNQFGARISEEDPARERRAKTRMRQPPYFLDAERRQIVLRTLEQVCQHRRRTLLAAHVRTTQVHVVVEADQAAECVMNALKAYDGRALNENEPGSTDQRRWARHGSTRYLWTAEDVSAAVHYVVSGQGKSMEVWDLARS